MATEKDKDVKKKGALASAAAKAKSTNPKTRVGLKEYFMGVRVEMKKVVWPTRKELISYTWTVLLTCVGFGLLFWLCDFVFMQGLKLALGFEFA
ncbi:MAG: preprotein translocase subunit SecE [Clostridiales Family XIII bacterium]|nr:preprotein translocase subunit SecE [Clostridiales Family XIII bacterium]